MDALSKKVNKDYFFHCIVAVDPDGPATGKVEAGWAIASVGGRTVGQILSPFDRSRLIALSRFDNPVTTVTLAVRP